MGSLKPFDTTASGLADDVRSGRLSVAEVAAHFADRTDRLAGKLNTHTVWNRDAVLEEAETQSSFIQAELKAGRSPALAGVPIVIKDNISCRGLPTTCGSKILEGFNAIYDATVVAKLRQAGALIFGKANMDEFAMGSSSENSAYGPVKNPWDETRVPGGSSGGSSAAVAADLAPLALGSDTGGSIRQPASFCGVVGFKPAYGRVSRYGLVAYASSLDQIGPMARTVKDTALLYDVISGHDERDSTSVKAEAATTFRHLSNIEIAGKSDLKGLKIGVIREHFGEGLNAQVGAAVQEAIADLKRLGAQVVELSMPSSDYSIATYYVIATAEASSNLSRFDGVRYGRRREGGHTLEDLYVATRSEGFGREVKQRIMLGTFALSSGYYDAYYNKATRCRQIIAEDFKKAFAEVDLIVGPAAPTTAFGLGQMVNDPLAMYLSDVYTIQANLVGIPALSVPCGFDERGLPIGLQFMAPHQGEIKLFEGAYIYEQATSWYAERRPSC